MKTLLKISLCALIVFLNVESHAEVCPTPLDIQAGNFNNWDILDINDGEPLSSDRIATFQNDVQSFALAEWERSNFDNWGHCYYYGKQKDNDYLGVFLSKSDLKPVSGPWKALDEDVQQCRAAVGLCIFQTP